MNNQNQGKLLEYCLGEFKIDNQLTQLSDGNAFELFAAALVFEQYHLSFSEISDGIVDGSQDGGIDGFYILVNGQAIVDSEQIDTLSFTRNTDVNILIIQSKYELSFKEVVLDRINATIPLIFDLGIDEAMLSERLNEALVEKVMSFRSVWRSAASKSSQIYIHYFYVSKANDLNVNKAFLSKVEQIKKTTFDSVQRCKINFTLFNAQRLMDLIQQSASVTLELRFKEAPVAIEFDGDELGYLGVVGINDYCKFIMDDNNRIRENLFESNIRHFQGNVDVNTGIMVTLSEEQDKNKDFWWLNNGITMIASDCRPRAKELHIDNVQIVNGLQTSFALYKHVEAREFEYEPDESRSLLVKVIQTNKQETIDKIISASNSQTPVPPALLKATEKIQRDIEIFLLSKGFYYDRRKNFYKNQGKSASKIISIQNLAQMYESIVHTCPSVSRASPTSLFRDEEKYKLIFKAGNPLEVYYICIILYNAVQDYIKSEVLPREEKSFVRNFSYHWSRILASLVIGKANYTYTEVSTISEDSLNATVVKRGYDILKRLVSEYKSIYNEESIANIAKSKSFTDFINGNLEGVIESLTNKV